MSDYVKREALIAEHKYVKIYGCSDDLVEIENSTYQENEIDCWNKDVRITFMDGTVIRIGYHKPGKAVWWIRKEIQGPANQSLKLCDDENADVYSDVFEIESEILTHWVIPREAQE